MQSSTRFFTSLLLCACLAPSSANAANAAWDDDEEASDSDGVPEDVLGAG